ncbi:MAG: UDP-N-acetylglucosamine 2-epimerase (non-hydrolyzing) [Candidatus Krumholzibacteriia bacterium]
MKALTVFGTRPEAIKLAPVVHALRERSGVEVEVCVTAQHREMLDQVLSIFDIRPDVDLDLMRHDQSLASLTAAVVERVSGVLQERRPDLVIVQGDTTTAFAAGLAAFYHRIPVAHVEAGLRTNQRYAPFPEEVNRRFISCFAEWHFVPTERAREALLAENCPDDRIHVVGNTVIDALLSVLAWARTRGFGADPALSAVLATHPFVLITGHRRENFGDGFRNVCLAISDLARAHPEVRWVYPVHLNPNVSSVVHGMLGGRDNIHLVPPVDYLDFVWLMDAARLILTDSGGVQEEGPSLGKPVLVMRETTERPEAVTAGVAALVGTRRHAIVERTHELLTDPAVYASMTAPQNPYGDGTSARQIVEVLLRSGRPSLAVATCRGDERPAQ